MESVVKLTIFAKSDTNISKLLTCVPNLMDLTIVGGYLTGQTGILQNSDSHAMSLINTRVDKHALEPLLKKFASPSMKNLAIIRTERRGYNEHFEILSKLFLTRLNQDSNIENLIFTLNQDGNPLLDHLNKLTKLKSIIIYFSAQESIVNIFELITELLKRKDIEITMCESYDYYKYNNTFGYARTVSERVRRLKELFLTTQIKAEIQREK